MSYARVGLTRVARDALMCTLAVLLAAAAAVAAPAPARRGRRPGAPGALSHFDLARKDCVGTARNTTSRVWFTVADGVLSDVYEPNVDTTNVETMQYVVTDGRTFTDLQSARHDLPRPSPTRPAWPARSRARRSGALPAHRRPTRPTPHATRC